MKGHSFADFYIKDPVAMIKAITRSQIFLGEKPPDPNINFEGRNFTYYEILLQDFVGTVLRNLKDVDMSTQNSILYVTSDFNQQNILSRAIQQNAQKSCTILLDLILGQEKSQFYQPEIVKSISEIL